MHFFLSEGRIVGSSCLADRGKTAEDVYQLAVTVRAQGQLGPFYEYCNAIRRLDPNNRRNGGCDYFHGSDALAQGNAYTAEQMLSHLRNDYPTAERAPEGLLALAGLYEVRGQPNDDTRAKETRALVIQKYPSSAAAAAARRHP